MAVRNSKVILSKNIKMDSEYRNVLNISEADMITLMSNSSNLVYTNSTYSFLRESENSIFVEAPYGTCLQANYIAFQNPDYSNKWFFAFIEDIVYVNNKTTEIQYKLDIFTTWNSYFNYKSCFVVREHVTDDTLGANTVPEGLETGDYIVNSHLSDSYNTQMGVVISAPCLVDGSESTGHIYDGTVTYSALTYINYSILSNLATTLLAFESVGKLDAIQSIYMIPNWLVPDGDHHYTGLSTITQRETPMTQDLGISRISTLDGYTPVNNKCLTYPYCYIMGSNGAGASAIYKQELWQLDNKQEMVFRMYGTICSGASIRGVPINYNGDGVGVDYGINLAKFPVLDFPSDTFTNWLTQNGVNVGLSLAGSGLAIGTGLMTGNAIGVASGVLGIAQTVGQVYQRNEVPPQLSGNINGGDIGMATNFSRYNFYRMTVRSEYARIIDNYFKLRGYKVNKIKVPNTSHRQNFNFVQIASEDNVAYSNNHNNISVPPKDLNTINELFRRGITIWNNHTNLGDFSVSNNIVN